MAAAPTGGAGTVNALADSRATGTVNAVAATVTGPLADIVVVKGAIRAIPYSAVAAAVKAGKRVGGGATGALKIEVRKKPMLYKRGRPGQVANEYIAYQLFEAMGARVPASYLVVNVEAGGIPMGVMTEFLSDGLTVAQAVRDGIPTDEALRGDYPYNDPAVMKPVRRMRLGERTQMTLAIRDEFVYHALLLNWDAKNWENHMIVPLTDKTGMDIDHPYVLDPGGALFYRAMGEPKRRGDLSPGDIPELTRMPELSNDTRGKFYVDLVDPGTLRGTVCRKFGEFDLAAILRVVENLRPLFGFLPQGADLPGLIAGRLGFLWKFCQGAISPREIKLATEEAEYTGLSKPIPPGVRMAENLDTKIARVRYASKVEGLAEEATAGFRMRGKRALIMPPPLEEEDFAERFRIYDRPIRRERRHAGMDKYGFEYPSNSSSEGDDDTEDSEKHDVYPKPYFTVRLDRTADAERVRHAVLASREDAAIDAWLRAQVAYIKGLSTREYHILSSYTKNGDVLVNNYLRGTLRADTTDLVLASLEVTEENPNRPVALAYSLYEQYPTLTRDRRFLMPERAELQAGLLGDDGEIDMRLIRDIIGENIEYFGKAENLGPLIEQYRRDLVAIIERAPRPPHTFTVFRGINSEAYLSSLGFRNVDFLSTSISPEWAAKLFTKEIKDADGAVSQVYRCCLYELEVRPDVPCIYMQFVSEYPDEYEVLITPGMSVSLESTVRLKMVIEHDAIEGIVKHKGRSLLLEDLKKYLVPESTVHTKIAVVEGSVRRPARGATASAAAAVLVDSEEGSFEGMVAKHGRRVSSGERFASAKPRSMTVGRNRTRRRSAGLRRKARRRATRRLSTIRSSGSGRKD